MVTRCNNVGVRIIVDVVLNHMVGVGEIDNVNAGSSWTSFYNGTSGAEQFPGVPYGSGDFNDFRCTNSVQGSDYSNSAVNVRNCRLEGLLDLNQAPGSWVASQIVYYLNQLVGIGVAGFRVDAATNMWPTDLLNIFQQVNNLNSAIFGANQRPFIVQEFHASPVILQSDYVNNGRVTNFDYGQQVSQAVWRGNQHFQSFANFGPSWNYYGTSYAYGEDHDNLAFIDNHDTQRDGTGVLTYKYGAQYCMAISYMLAWPFAYTRVMSSYAFSSSDQGPPTTGYPSWTVTSPTFLSDTTCNTASGWICEHRWLVNRQMARFRSVTAGSAATDIVTGTDQIAFAREGTGYFAINNNANSAWSLNGVQTTLPAGTYCNVYFENIPLSPAPTSCSTPALTVASDGTASFSVPAQNVLAVHLGSRIGGYTTATQYPSGYTKTVIFIQLATTAGQYLFVRGGNNNNNNCNSPASTSSCAIPIYDNTTVPLVFDEYLGFHQNDNYLDWFGAEPNQGTHDGVQASGTPLVYSTNDPTAVEYQPYNKYGPNYWMVQVMMNCSQLSATNGWFDFKGYLTPSSGWEGSISQVSSCGGAVGGSSSIPSSTGNHHGRCGYVNVVQWNGNGCTIDNI
jgi:hypothetical protein